MKRDWTSLKEMSLSWAVSPVAARLPVGMEDGFLPVKVHMWHIGFVADALPELVEVVHVVVEVDGDAVRVEAEAVVDHIF